MCQECDWEELADEIDTMMASGDFDWANDTLSGIMQWITEKEHATDGQWSAVDNIESKGDK